MNVTVNIPNQYRNNSLTYEFIINTDTNLRNGDYMTFAFTGLWTLWTNATNIIEGVISSTTNTPSWNALVNKTSNMTTLTLSNFSLIPRSRQFTFSLPLVTPLEAATYTLSISAFR